MYIFMFIFFLSALIIFSKVPRINKLLNIFTDANIDILKNNISQNTSSLNSTEMQNMFNEKMQLRKKYITALNLNKKKYSKAKELLFMCIKQKKDLRAIYTGKSKKTPVSKIKKLKEIEKNILAKQLKLKKSLVFMKKKAFVINENLSLVNQDLEKHKFP